MSDKPRSVTDDIPRTAEQIAELAKWAKGHGDDASFFVAYLVRGCGLAPVMVRRVLARAWPEAAPLVYVTNADQCREVCLQLRERRLVIAAADEAVKQCGVTQAEADNILTEWDSIMTPEQVPAPVRRVALERLRSRMGFELAGGEDASG